MQSQRLTGRALCSSDGLASQYSQLDTNVRSSKQQKAAFRPQREEPGNVSHCGRWTSVPTSCLVLSQIAHSKSTASLLAPDPAALLYTNSEARRPCESGLNVVG